MDLKNVLEGGRNEDDPPLEESPGMADAPSSSNEAPRTCLIVPRQLDSFITSLTETLEYLNELKEIVHKSVCNAEKPLDESSPVIKYSSLPGQRKSSEYSKVLVMDKAVNTTSSLNSTKVKGPGSDRSPPGSKSVSYSDPSSCVPDIEALSFEEQPYETNILSRMNRKGSPKDKKFNTLMDKYGSSELSQRIDFTNNSKSSNISNTQITESLENSNPNICIEVEDRHISQKSDKVRWAKVSGISESYFAPDSPVPGDYKEKFSLNVSDPVSFFRGDRRMSISSPVTLLAEDYESDCDLHDPSNNATSSDGKIFGTKDSKKTLKSRCLLQSSESGKKNDITFKHLGKKCQIEIERGYGIPGDGPIANSLFPQIKINESGVFLQNQITEKPQVTEKTQESTTTKIQKSTQNFQSENASNTDKKVQTYEEQNQACFQGNRTTGQYYKDELLATNPDLENQDDNSLDFARHIPCNEFIDERETPYHHKQVTAHNTRETVLNDPRYHIPVIEPNTLYSNNSNNNANRLTGNMLIGTSRPLETTCQNVHPQPNPFISRYMSWSDRDFEFENELNSGYRLDHDISEDESLEIPEIFTPSTVERDERINSRADDSNIHFLPIVNSFEQFPASNSTNIYPQQNSASRTHQSAANFGYYESVCCPRISQTALIDHQHLSRLTFPNSNQLYGSAIACDLHNYFQPINQRFPSTFQFPQADNPPTPRYSQATNSQSLRSGWNFNFRL